MDVSVVLAFFLAALAFFLLPIYLRRWKLKLPPGPKPWPIIGNLNLLGSLPHYSIHELAQKYGPIMQLYFGNSPVIVVSSPKMAEIVLKEKDMVLASRPKTAAGKYTTYNYSDMTWSEYGPYWAQLRKICLMEIFSGKRIDSFQYVRVEEMKKFMRSLYASSGKPLPLKDNLLNLTFNVINRIVLGKSYLDDVDNQVIKPEEFKFMFDELFVLNGVYNIGDYIPWLGALDLQGYVKRMKDVSKKLDRFMEIVINEHIEARNKSSVNGEDYVAKDMVDVLLNLADDQDVQVKLQRDGVKGFTQDLIAGGIESAATSLEWGLSEMLKNPKIFETATEELDRVIGQERWVEEKDIQNLPYIEAISKEIFRVHPVAPLLAPHMAMEDCKISDYDILKGTIVLINTWTIERDPNIWPDPYEFRPERFMGVDIDVTGRDFRILPFGSGRRRCPGYSLGLKLIQLNLANILHGFSWKLPENMKAEELNMEETYGLSVPRKVPLVAVAEPRLPSHLYA
ncbi:trimethyltridecatetraene synthase-like [Heracleum sosnowskyi]|uniref:Trimethyltridecatetraene synthase-like n=1 Tax=Heracleum sosnowskyi TaxID=360622 RepID=A0AAD8IDL1_9APIA|nr:trimethyltridecatetraene synthase-like [Heracleum sosnowskyi]